MKRRPEYSIVVPVYNEEAALPELVRRLGLLLDRLDGPAETVLVDDGSSDRTYELMAAARDADPRLKILRLSRNFGHQVAVTAGLDVAAGDAVIVMDADLQDPPEVVLEMAARWREGYDVVYADSRGAARRDALQAGDRRGLLPHLQRDERGRGAARRRRLPARRSAGARRVQVDARVESLRAWDVQLDRVPPGRECRTSGTSGSRGRRSTPSRRW